jgi:hypothetical protein
MKRTLHCAFLLLLCSVAARAGGPLLVGSPSFGVDGQPFVWSNAQPVQYRVDSGTLGPLSNSSATADLTNAFAAWTQVPTASIAVSDAGPILGVTNGHVASVTDFDSVLGSCDSGQQSPMIFDSNGTIFSQLIGDASVVGFTSPCELKQDGHILSALSVFTGGSNLTEQQQKQVMLHELGHFFGLDHSLPGEDPCGTSAADVGALPIMYFQMSSQTGLAPDDKAWISWLYPSPSFNSVYGTITGLVLFSDGQSHAQDVLTAAHPAMPGTNAGEDRSQAWSSISGFRFTGNPGQSYTSNYLACTPASACPHGFYGNNVDGGSFGSRNPALLGWYEIPIPAGTYAVEASSINDGGVIGPNNPVIPIPGPGEYWNAHESATDANFSNLNCSALRQLDYITVQAGQVTPNINIILDNTAPTFDIFEGPNATASANITGVHP